MADASDSDNHDDDVEDDDSETSEPKSLSNLATWPANLCAVMDKLRGSEAPSVYQSLHETVELEYRPGLVRSCICARDLALIRPPT
jgi:hypothetical protein